MYTGGESMRIIGSGASTFFAGDILGSVEDVSDSTGATPAHVVEYEPFGNVLYGSGPAVGSPFRYCGAAGYQTSPDTGLMLAGNRWYDPSIGRFLSPDPSGSGDNPYAYAGNNPVSNLDPLGLDPGNANPSPSSDDSQDLSGLLQAGEKWVGKGFSWLGHQLFGSGPGDFQASQFAQNAVSALHYHFGNTSSTFDRYLSAPTYGLPYFSILQGDPYGDFLTQATPIAGQLALAMIPGGGEAEFVGPSLGILEGKSGMVSESGLAMVEAHLGTLDAAGYNDAMIGRLGAAMASGQPISGADLVFYTHELSEAQFMKGGMGYDEAHAAALGKYGVSPFSVYHPAVISQFPDDFQFTLEKCMGPLVIDVPYHPQGRARVWLDKLPECFYATEHIESANLPATAVVQTVHNKVAVELWYHSGGFFPYGLLGLEYNANSSDVLNIEICCSSQQNTLWVASLAGNQDEVYVGLPQEYAESIIDAVGQETNNGLLGGGVLRCDCAAHGALGSSIRVFRRLARIAIALLTLSEASAVDENLAEIVRRTI